MQANWKPIFLTFSSMKFMFCFVVHKIDVCFISLHTLEVTLQLFRKAAWCRKKDSDKSKF